MTTRLRVSLLILFIFQVLISLSFELAHDEAYYWLYSRHLDFGYFDHPPLAGVVIRLFSFLGHSEFSLRFGFVVLQFATILLLLKLIPQKWHSWAVLLFFAFPLASVGGLLALPDMPLLFMAAVYVFCLKRFLENDGLIQSLSLGAAIALLFYAKYHGVLLVFFTIVAVPKVVLKRSFYVVALVALVLFFPHLCWQYEHDFATLRYHFIERPASTFSLKRSAEYLGLQLVLAGLFAGPALWWSIVKLKTEDQFFRALKLISLGTVIFFLISSFSKKTEANWTIFLAAPLLVLSFQTSIWERKWQRGLLQVSFAICLAARLLFPLNPVLKRMKEFHGWEQWAGEVAEKCAGKNLMANSYQIASKLSFYLQREVPSLNYRSRKNQFDYWQFEKKFVSDEVCYVTDKSQFSGTETNTPEGKSLKIVTDVPLSELLRKKRDLLR